MKKEVEDNIEAFSTFQEPPGSSGGDLELEPIVMPPKQIHSPLDVSEMRCHLQETMEEALSGEEPMPRVSSLPWLKKLLLLHTMFAHLNFRDLRKMLNLPTTGPDPQCLYCAQTKLNGSHSPR